MSPRSERHAGPRISRQRRSSGQPRPRRPGGAFNYPAPPLTAFELPVEAFQAFLREPANDILAFSPALLSDKEAADMWAWLHALPGRKPAKNFPLLNQ